MRALKSIVVGIVAVAATTVMASKEIKFEDHGFKIEQTVYKIPVNEGVTAAEVHESIMSKGAELNMKFVGHQPLSKELDARGVEGGQVDIYQFCNPLDARKMIDFNPIFVAYMPCRIALVEDKNNKMWLMMVNLDMLINNTKLTPEIMGMANGISDKLKALIEFAKEGEF